MATRNRALRAIENLIAERERAVIEAAILVFGPDSDDLPFDEKSTPMPVTVSALIDARALLAKATGATDTAPEPGA